VVLNSKTETRPTVRLPMHKRIRVQLNLPRETRTIQQAFIGGVDSSEVLIQTLATLAARKHLSKPASGVIPLACDSIGQGDAITLVFGANDTFLKKVNPQNLLGAHHHFWTSEGVVPFWRGVCYPSKMGSSLQRGSLVEKQANGAERVTLPLNSPLVLPHPKNIIFMVEDTKNALPTLSKLSASQAVQHLLAGYNGSTFEPYFGTYLVAGSDPKNIVDPFKAYLEKHQASVYLINISGQGRPMPAGDLEAMLKAIQEGAAVGAPVGSGFTTLSPISKLSNYNLQTNVGPHATKFEQNLKEFLKTNFPSVTF